MRCGASRYYLKVCLKKALLSRHPVLYIDKKGHSMNIEESVDQVNVIYPNINLSEISSDVCSYSLSKDNSFGRVTVAIPHRFPGINEMIAFAKKGSGGKAYSRMKKKYTSIAFRVFVLSPILFQDAYIKAIWNERTKRRDPDNVMGGIKFILDGMVTSGLLPDDTQKVVKNINQTVLYSTKERKIEEDFIYLQILGKVLTKR